MTRKWAGGERLHNSTYQTEVRNLENRSLCILVDCHNDLNLGEKSIMNYFRHKNFSHLAVLHTSQVLDCPRDANSNI